MAEIKQRSIESIGLPRKKTISAEVRTAGVALNAAETNLQAVQAAYDMAVQRFKSAHAYLKTDLEAYPTFNTNGVPYSITEWMLSHAELSRYAYTALSLGEAIEAVLTYEANAEGGRMKLAEMIGRLRQGRFPFKEAALREVKTALIKLKGIGSDGISYWLEPEEPPIDEVPIE